MFSAPLKQLFHRLDACAIQVQRQIGNRAQVGKMPCRADEIAISLAMLGKVFRFHPFGDVSLGGDVHMASIVKAGPFQRIPVKVIGPIAPYERQILTVTIEHAQSA